MPSPGRTRQGVRRPSAHIPAPAHRPDAAARAPGNIGHGRGNEARVTGRTTGRNDPPARVTGTAAVAGGRSPGMPASALAEPADRRPEAPRPWPTARCRPHAQHGRRTADRLPAPGDRVHRTVQLGAPVSRPSHMATRRRDATGRDGTAVTGAVAPPDGVGTSCRSRSSRRAGCLPCFHRHGRAAPGRGPAVHQWKRYTAGRTPPPPMPPCEGSDSAAAPAGSTPCPGRDASPQGKRIATVIASDITLSGLARL